MKSNIRLTLALFVVIILVQFPAIGQLTNTVYFMPGVPQANRINPAIQPNCRYYGGVPLLSPLRFQVSSSSLAYEDVLIYDNSLDLLITPFHPEANTEAFINKLNEVNYFLSSLGTSYISTGLGMRKSFLTLDVSTRVDGNVYYPKGLFSMLEDGFGDGSTVTLNGLGLDLNIFNEIAIGWSRRDFLIPNLTIGVRGKLLFGLANMYTSKSEFSIQSSREEWNLATDMEMRAAVPSFAVDIIDSIDSFDPAAMIDDILEDPLGAASSLFDQFGLAADVGINYRPVPQLNLSASILDIGSINYKNSIQAGYNFSYDFNGVFANPFSGIDTSFISELTDSLVSSNAYSLDEGGPYSYRLNPKLFVGVAYYPIEKIGFGLLSRTDFLKESISQQFTGTVNMTTGRHLNLSLSYSYMSNTFDNMGAGLSFVFRPLNLYLVSDNIISGALRPMETRSINLWFGMNITFGWKKAAKKAKAVDKPLIL